MGMSRCVHRPLIVAAALLIGSIAAVGSGATSNAAPAAGASAYTPNQPCRLLDTREEPGRTVAPKTLRIDIAGRCGAPADVSAAVLTLTVTRPTGPGHLTVYPAGTERPTASNVNYTAGRTTANTAIVVVRNGAVDLYVHTDTEVSVDLDGTFRPVTGAVSAGRLESVAPTRIADTRDPTSFEGSRVTTRGSGDLLLPLPDGVPADATGVAISVVSVNSAPGHITVHPAGTPRPNASVVNTDAYVRTRGTTVLAPVSDDGIVLHRVSEGDLVVDLWGWFTGPSAPASTDGLFVPESPTRVWDSRTTNDPLHDGGALTKTMATDDAAVVALNVTAVGATEPGHLTVGRAGSTRPATSTVNFQWSEPAAAATLVRNTTAGVTFWAQGGTHVVVDRFGWFTGGAAPASAAADRNPVPTTGGRVLFVADSSFAGIRWNGALPLLQGADFDARLESCRRLIGSSCFGREGYRPYNAVTEVLSVTPGSVDVLVVGTGYNDFASRFHEGFVSVMEAARRVGIPRVVWITYRESVGYTSPAGASNAATYAANNAILRSEWASARWPELTLLDWNAYSAGHPDWVTSDGVHFTVAGAREAAMYVSRALASYDRRTCPSGIGGATERGGWCALPG